MTTATLDKTQISFPHTCKGKVDREGGFSSIVIQVPGSAISPEGLDQLLSQGDALITDLESGVLTIVH